MLTLSEVTGIQGEAGDFTVSVKQAPRYVDMDKCIACGLCAEKCPKKVTSEYDAGLINRKAIYVPYPQAVPLKYVIDAQSCIYLEKGKCGACEKFCPAGAINFKDTEKDLTLNVGSVILTAGFQAYDPKGLDNYQYARLPNVVTSLEFERLLSAGGPTKGAITRPSDGAEVSKIAWLQCVGSRDFNKCDNAYCSSVCCMYALKEAMMVQDHVAGAVEPTIFFMDIRTYGKDFEKYYERAKGEGVRFVRSRIHTIEEAPDGTLDLRYVTEDGQIVDESFDIAVLSVGMESTDSLQRLAETLDIDLNASRFVQTDELAPMSTSRPGIYVAGVARGCKDIPDSVMEASAAAGSAACSLTRARGSLIKQKTFPEERLVADSEPRIGVFVCNCGSNIGGIADVPAVAAYARTLPGVVYVEENLFTCSQDTQDKMAEVIASEGLNRVVVAACTPRTHEALFQETLRNAGLNPYLFEMANIRNQCTWVHKDKVVATAKAKDLVAMSVARANRLEPLKTNEVDVHHSVLVVGGGVAGMTATKSLADQGFHAILVEKSPELGGGSRAIKDPKVVQYLKTLIGEISSHPDIEVFTDAEIASVNGFIGNFETEVQTGAETRTLSHGAAILATGGQAADTDEYGYHTNPRVTRWHDLWDHPDIDTAENVVFIQCVGSRDENRPYCSKVCCTASIENAIKLKESKPDRSVYILYRDIRTYGEKERLYQKARQMGVVFIRYALEKKPVVTETDRGAEVVVHDYILGRDVSIAADIVNLATAIEPADNAELARMFKVSTNAERFLIEAHAKLRPVESATDGVYICGLAHYPKFMEESIAQAQAAASRATTVLSREHIDIEPIVSTVDEELCIGCGLCEMACPFSAIRLVKVEGKGYRAQNISALCKGCGICASSCPQKAIDMRHFRDEQIEAAISACA